MMTEVDLAAIYGEKRQPIVGVIYYLVHRQGRINFVKLKEKLQSKVDIEEIYEEEILKGSEEELYVPEIFKDEEQRLLLKTTIDKTILTPSSLFGRSKLDRVVMLEYRDRRILVIDTTEIFFMILNDDKTKRNFLVVLGSRADSRELFLSLNKFMEDLGIKIVPSKLEPERIDEVCNELRGQLLDTTLWNFPTPRIKMKRIVGRGYQNEPSYLQDAEIGSVRQHMFEYKRGANPSKVINLSEDGLVRFYTGITYRDYESFLRMYVFHRLRQIKKPEVPIVAYTTANDIFEKEEQKKESETY
jgi:hypothetical protein